MIYCKSLPTIIKAGHLRAGHSARDTELLYQSFTLYSIVISPNKDGTAGR